MTTSLSSVARYMVRRFAEPPPIIRYMARRCAQAVLLLLAVTLINFTLIQLAPGDPAMLFMDERAMTPEKLQEIRHNLGLDRPAYVQLFSYLRNVVTLDFGTSFRYGIPVTDLIAIRLPPTLLLASTGLLFSSIIGVIVGALAAQRPGSPFDTVSSLLALGAYSLPMFWLGQLLLIFFALQLGWFPTHGMVSLSLEGPSSGLAQVVDVLRHLLLPGLAFSAYPLALIFRMTRAKVGEVLASDFVTTTRAKGLSDRRILFRHALPNGFLPVLTVITYQAAFLLAGSVLVEAVFNWPGMGSLLAQSTMQRDYPVLIALSQITATMVVTMSIISDLCYGILDPRIASPATGEE